METGSGSDFCSTHPFNGFNGAQEPLLTKPSRTLSVAEIQMDILFEEITCAICLSTLTPGHHVFRDGIVTRNMVLDTFVRWLLLLMVIIIIGRDYPQFVTVFYTSIPREV